MDLRQVLGDNYGMLFEAVVSNCRWLRFSRSSDVSCYSNHYFKVLFKTTGLYYVRFRSGCYSLKMYVSYEGDINALIRILRDTELEFENKYAEFSQLGQNPIYLLLKFRSIYSSITLKTNGLKYSLTSPTAINKTNSDIWIRMIRASSMYSTILCQATNNWSHVLTSLMNKEYGEQYFYEPSKVKSSR